MELTPEQLAADESTSPEELTKLAKQSIELARIVAANASAEPELLKQLATTKDSLIRQRVAENPNTPKEILFELAEKFPDEFFSNPVFSLLWLENPDFYEDLPGYTIHKLFLCEKIPEKLRSQIKEYDYIPF